MLKFPGSGNLKKAIRMERIPGASRSAFPIYRCGLAVVLVAAALVERHRPAVLLVTHDVDEALLLAFRARLNQNAPFTVPRQPTTPTEEDT